LCRVTLFVDGDMFGIITTEQIQSFAVVKVKFHKLLLCGDIVGGSMICGGVICGGALLRGKITPFVTAAKDALLPVWGAK
jgi:hypothetical protein